MQFVSNEFSFLLSSCHSLKCEPKNVPTLSPPFSVREKHNTVLIIKMSDLQSCTSHYNAGTWGIVQGQLRPLLAPRVYTLPMVRSIGKTMVQGKNYGPQITVKRISTRSVSTLSCGGIPLLALFFMIEWFFVLFCFFLHL